MITDQTFVKLLELIQCWPELWLRIGLTTKTIVIVLIDIWRHVLFICCVLSSQELTSLWSQLRYCHSIQCNSYSMFPHIHRSVTEFVLILIVFLNEFNVSLTLSPKPSMFSYPSHSSVTQLIQWFHQIERLFPVFDSKCIHFWHHFSILLYCHKKQEICFTKIRFFQI